MAQSLQRVAAGASFISRCSAPALVHAAGHADVFSGRSAARLRPDVQQHSRRTRAAPADRRLRLGAHDSRHALGYRFDIVLRGRDETPMETKRTLGISMSLLTTSSQTVGPYLQIGFTALAVDAIAAPGVAGERSRSKAASSTATASRSTMRSSKSGRPMPAASTRTPKTRPASAAGKFRGFGRILTDAEGAFRFTTIKPGRSPGPKGATAGAASGRHHVHARIAEASADAHLLSRRSGQRQRPDPAAGSRRAPCDDWSRSARRRRRRRCSGISSCRARTKPCFSISDQGALRWTSANVTTRD